MRDIPVRIGDWLSFETLWKNLCPGMPPSRANAYIIRLFDVSENVPQKNIAPMTITCARPNEPPLTHVIQTFLTYHEHDSALLPDGVQEYLRDGLSGRRADGPLQVLDGEQQAEDEEPPEHGGAPDRHHDADGPGHCCVVRLLCHLLIYASVMCEPAFTAATHVCTPVEAYDKVNLYLLAAGG